MSFVMCMGDEIFFAALVFLVSFGGACLAGAIFATAGLARWAAARQRRLAADGR